MVNQRKIALNALIAVGEDLGYSNIVLKKALGSADVTDNDKPFITTLFYGVLDRLITLDYIILRFTKKPLKRITPITLNALRLAIFQLMYLDKVPQSAAVNESVKLVKNSKESYNTAFANAVLREFLRNRPELPTDNSVTSLKIRYSCPEWIIESFIKDYGIDETVILLEHFMTAPKITLRVNTRVADVDGVISSLESFGVAVSKGSVPDSLILDSGADIGSLDIYKNGSVYAQDIPSQTAVMKLQLSNTDRLLDMCASPGGKSFTAAQYVTDGEIVSCDIYENRVNLIISGEKRLNIGNITGIVCDSSKFNRNLGEFDAVICDVPCSGLGVIRRKPEIKYKKDLDFDSLADTQRNILDNAANYLKVNGKILYSTCTLRKAENEEMVLSFLNRHSDFKLLFEHTFLPSTDGTDGFYYAVLKRG